MRMVFEAWDQFAYGSVCSRDSKKNSVVTRLRQSRTRSSIKQVVHVGAVMGAVFVSNLSVSAAMSSQLPQTPSSAVLKQLKVGPTLGKGLRRVRDYLKMTREEASALIGVSESALQNIEEGEVETPRPEAFREYMRFIDLGNYLQSATGDRRFMMIALFRSELPAFGNKSAIEYARSQNESSLPYISATFRRMYG